MFMFEELLVSPQHTAYLVSHRAAVASANDRRSDRSPTTQMNRGALTARGRLLRWDLIIAPFSPTSLMRNYTQISMAVII